MRAHPVLFLCLLAILAMPAAGQDLKSEKDAAHTDGVVGNITDGINRWEINVYNANTGATTDFEVPIGTDHQFQTWWWYRVAGDSAETILPPPDSDSFVGDTATLTWNDVDGRGLFAAVLVVRIVSDPPGSILLQDLTIDNLSGGSLDLQLFHYTDMDMDGSLLNDSAEEVTPSQMEITEVSFAEYFGFSPNYQVDVFPVVRDNLTDGNVDNFTGTGLPFGPDDYTGGFQTGGVIASGGSDIFFADLCVNTCSDLIFQDGFETGDTTGWSNTIP